MSQLITSSELEGLDEFELRSKFCRISNNLVRSLLRYGLFRNFDGVLIVSNHQQHNNLKMFYLCQVSGFPPQPFAGIVARAF